MQDVDIDMEHVDMDTQHGPGITARTWTSSLDKDLQHWHEQVAWTCTCSTDTQHWYGHAAGTWNYGHPIENLWNLHKGSSPKETTEEKVDVSAERNMNADESTSRLLFER
jgi:hypothetical protein